jgi:protocatechuate 3,4-dioxygenase alpha subunit
LKSDALPDVELIPTASQTAGPFFHLGLTNDHSISQIAPPGLAGERIRLICTVYDADGKPLPDSMVEIWQANSEGKYRHPDDTQPKPVEEDFRGFGRLATDAAGACAFETIKPGRVPSWTDVPQAPHLLVSVFARGILQRLATRAYFLGDPANDADPVLALVPGERRETLMARPDPKEPGVWRFEIHLSGPRETVFFDV